MDLHEAIGRLNNGKPKKKLVEKKLTENRHPYSIHNIVDSIATAVVKDIKQGVDQDEAIRQDIIEELFYQVYTDTIKLAIWYGVFTDKEIRDLKGRVEGLLYEDVKREVESRI